MRILELRLLAYGPFDGTTIDVSAPGLHVIVGRNEAGKSTTLRAISGLFYGIAAQTKDAYLHKNEDLRVGARLRGDDGALLDVVRRKGRTKTLLDPKGIAIDDAELTRMLHGVGPEVFQTTFGLSHVTLREGGEALLSGQGDLGESLFQAGLGGSALHALLTELREEADRIFSPQAKTKPLNEAIRAYTEAQKALRETSSTPDAWTAQEKGIEEAHAERARIAAERGELARAQKRLARLQRAFPPITRRAILSERLAELADVPVLAEDASRLRADALRERADAEAAIERLAREIGQLEERRAGLRAPDALADLDAEMTALRARLGAYASHAGELPRARAGLDALEAETRRVLRALGRDVTHDRVHELRIDDARAARLRRLAGQEAAILEKRRAAGRARQDAAARLEARRAQPEGASERTQRLAQSAARKLKALGLFAGTLDEACALPVPSLESVARFEALEASRAQARARHEARAAEIEQRAAEVARDLDALQRAGAVPTEEDLAAARAARDEAWSAYRASPSDAKAGVFEASMRGADALVDRLRREAERVARLARLLAERKANAAELASARAAIAEIDARAKGEDDAWRALWAPCAVAPLSPGEMRAWLGRHAQLVEAWEQVRAAEAEDRGSMARELEALAREVARHDAEDAEQARALDAWKAAWREATAPLALGADPAVEEATAALDALAGLFARVDAAEKERARVGHLEREIAQIAVEVRELASRHAPDLANAAPLDAGDQLVKRFENAREERAERRRVDEQLAERTRARAEHVERAERADRRLAELVHAARVTDASALEDAERRSDEVRALRRELDAVESRLVELAEGIAPDAIASEAAETTPEAVGARLDEIERRLAELDDEKQRVDQRIGGLELARGRFSEANASEAAADAQEKMARVRAQAERYVRARLAELVLSREVDRYREANQGPVLSRASALFERLTGGAYAGLKTAYDEHDRVVLRCARPDTDANAAAGADVAVDVLSDGARDQLYLALRIASLERIAKAGGALPLILDDVLIHFDDARARAALEVLVELSRTIQVLFFTHNEHMVELARAACGRELTVHELAARASGPRIEARA